MRIPRPKRLLALAAVAALATTACGAGETASTDSDPGSSSAAESDVDTSAGGELTPVKVALLPTVTKAPMYLGMDKGFFEEEGLEVEASVVQSGAAVAAAVTSGEADFASSALVPTVTAADKGLDVRVVMTAASATPPDEPAGPYGDAVLVVADDSDITSIDDLEGATIAVNALKAGLELAVRGAIDRLGGDSSSVNFLAVPFPEMATALADGQVDAIAPVEPFVTAATEDGHRVLHHAFPYDVTEVGEFVNSVYFTSGAFADANPDVVQAFKRAIERSNAYAQEHPDEVRSMIPVYTGLGEDVAEQISLPTYPATLDREAYAAEIDLMKHYGFIESTIDEATFYVE